MRVTVIGCGQCGGRIADEFCRISNKAHYERGMEITAGVFAVNTDIADLSGLKYIKKGFKHRIIIGNQKTGGHGVGKLNEIGAEVAKEDGDKVIEAITSAPDFHQSDAFILIASAAGGTGSGVIGILTQYLKERYIDRPVYNIIVLPFAHEESEGRAIYNTATCLKSVYLVADAIFLVDNQRFVKKNFSIRENIKKINRSVAEPFYDLLCAGEERTPKYIGAKIMDAGDITQTLAGWTSIGQFSLKVGSDFSWLGLARSTDFRNKASETQTGIQVLNGAITDMSIKCDAATAKRGLYLVSAPPELVNMDILKSMGDMVRSMSPEATIRAGDYPRAKNYFSVTLILSELVNVPRVTSFFTRALDYVYTSKKKQEGIRIATRSIEDSFRDIPSLLK